MLQRRRHVRPVGRNARRLRVAVGPAYRRRIQSQRPPTLHFALGRQYRRRRRRVFGADYRPRRPFRRRRLSPPVGTAVLMHHDSRLFRLRVNLRRYEPAARVPPVVHHAVPKLRLAVGKLQVMHRPAGSDGPQLLPLQNQPAQRPRRR